MRATLEIILPIYVGLFGGAAVWAYLDAPDFPNPELWYMAFGVFVAGFVLILLVVALIEFRARKR